MSESRPIAVDGKDVETSRVGGYVGEFATRVAGRRRKALGDFFGLENFGVNLTYLDPGSESSLLHQHSGQDELVYVLEGEPSLVMASSEIDLKPGMCAGFPKSGEAHHLVNRTSEVVVLLEIGDRLPGDEVNYPEDDIMIDHDEENRFRYVHKDGTPY